jgi:undecaprenyl-diphosphatase
LSALEALTLGLLQGLTEFLPISSSAHLRIAPALAGSPDPGAAFTAVVQLGTMAAELLFFRHDLRRIATRWLRSLRCAEARGTLDARLGWYLILATIPIGVLGLAFEDHIEGQARSLPLIGITLIVLGGLLLMADRTGRHDRGMAGLTLRDGVVMGCAQTFALVPGVSRSGATITAGLFLGLDRPTAARFSFLLSIPAVVLNGAFQAISIAFGDEASHAGALELIFATAVASAVGYDAIAGLLRYLTRHSTAIFVAYRVALGGLVIGLASAGAIE